MDNSNSAPVAVEKKSKGPVIGMIAFAILAIAGVGFGVYGMLGKTSTQDLKIQVKENDGTITTIDADKIEKTDGDKTITIVDSVNTMTIPQIRELLGKYIYYYHSGSNKVNLFEAGFSDEYKYLATIRSIDYKSRKTADSDEFVQKYDLTYDEVNEAYHKLFGDSSDVIKDLGLESGYCGIPAYSAVYDQYVSHGECGGTTGGHFGYEFLDFSSNKNKLTVKVAYLRTDMDVDFNGDGWNFKASDGQTIYLDTFTGLDKIVDQLPNYEFTFEKTDSGYVLTDFQKTN